MSIFYFLLNLMVLSGLIFWCWRQQSQAGTALKKLFFPALAFKLLCGILLGLLYKYYYGGDDTFLYHRQSLFLYEYFLDSPLAYLRLWLTNHFESETVRTSMVYYWYSNSYFMVIWLSLLDILTGGQYFLNALYFSLFSFWGTWQLVRAVAAFRPPWWPAAVAAFLFLPSAVFWSSGITKETVYLGALCWFLASLLKLAARQAPGRQAPAWWRPLPGLLVSAYLLWKIKFYFAAAVFPLACTYVLLTWAARRFPALQTFRIQALLFVLLLAGSGLVVSQLHTVFDVKYFLTQLLRSYETILAWSAGKPVLLYPNLEPSLGSVLAHAPLAAFYAALRPFIWEGEGWLYTFAGLENLLVLALGMWALARGLKAKSFRLDWYLLILGLYCLAIAALIGLSTPNVGSLSRYKTAFQPVLVFLLLLSLPWGRWLGRLPVGVTQLTTPGCSANKDQLPLGIKKNKPCRTQSS